MSPEFKEKWKKIWKRFIRVASIFSVFILAAFLCAAFMVIVVINKGLPSLQSLKNYQPKEVTQVFSDNGEVIGEFYEEKRFVIDQIPERVRQAFISAEDSNFYFHKGIDFIGIARASFKNLLAGGKKQGASTITQQVVRSILLSPEKTYSRKIREAILAWQIENYLTKDEILHLYLNHIFLGAGSYGVEAASRTYFGKSVNELTIAEAAILAGLPKAPSRYSPYRDPERLKRRQIYVLQQMRKDGAINQTQYDQAAKEEILIERPRDLNHTVAPYFTEYIRQYLMNKYGTENILQNGYKVYTTLDADMARYGQNALRKGLSDLEKRQGFSGAIKHLKADEVKNYFKDREAEDHEDEPTGSQDLEVSAKEAKGLGAIRMKPPRKLEVGDWIEGVVHKIDDAKKEALVEYEPGFYARINFADMKWAHARVKDDDEDAGYRAISKISDALQVGDVIPMSVKTLATDTTKPIEAQLEQKTDVEGAVLSVDPHNGFVRAMVGGYDFNRSQFNRAVQAKRQPGSAFKPIVYATALDLGWTPASILQDSPLTFENQSDQEKWRPSNYDQKFIGDTTVRNSLITSRNTTTIRLLNEVGIDPVLQYARRLGIESPLTRDFTLALGSSVVSLPEILQPYIVFATGGYRHKLIYIKRIVDRTGKVVEDNAPEDFTQSTPDMVASSVDALKKEIANVELTKADAHANDQSSVSFLQNSDKVKTHQVVTSPLKPGQVLSSEASYLMTYLLKENVLYGTGRRARDLDRPASGKTGTTEENRDAWFIGFTPDLVTGVWVGYDDLRILGRSETGSVAAVPIWLDYMVHATAPYPKTDFTVPDNIDFTKIDPKTGGLASAQTKGAIVEAFVKGTEPTKEINPNMNEMDLYQRDE